MGESRTCPDLRRHTRRTEPFFTRFDEIRPLELAPGVTGRPLFGEGAMVNLIEFEPGAVVPLHSHPHEQLGFVLRGPMGAYVIPGGVEHSAPCGPDGATVVDVFRPVREDYRERWSAGR